MNVEWERVVRPSEIGCSACVQRFAPGAEIVTTLDFDATGFRRQDLCQACFAGLSTPPFSFWRHTRPKDAKAGPRKLDLAYLTEFFKRLDTRKTEPTSVRVAYIVTLLLLRRRILEEIGRETKDDVTILRVRLRREDLEFDIQDPNLDMAAIASIEDDLSRLFDLNAPAN